MVRRGRWIRAGSVLGIVGPVALGGCLLELDRQRACGDGFVDEGQGEECEPELPRSYESACRGTAWPQGTADCDEQTCQIISDQAQCSICGDGLIDQDAGEECDLANLGSARCDAGGVLTCGNDCKLDRSGCEPCGNAELDPGEECDPRAGGLTTETTCRTLATAQYPYTSGWVTRCDDECRWDRTDCGYCGDERRDVDQEVVPGVRVTERCDGDDFDEDWLNTLEPGNDCMVRDDLRVNAQCNPNTCQDYEIRDVPDVCCIKPDAPCPQPAPGGGVAGFKCCYEFSHPDEAEFCQDRTSINEDGQLETSKRCR